MMQQVKLVESGEYYVMGGQRYARITKVCSVVSRPGLEAWKVRVGQEEAERIADETSEYGNRVHRITMLNDQKRVREVEIMLNAYPELLAPLLAWQEWVNETVKRILVIERTVVSVRLKVAGTIDRVLVMRGDVRPSITDIKTGGLHDEIGMQLAGYKIVYNEKAKQKVDRRIAVQLPRKNPGDRKVKEYTNKRYEDDFMAAHHLYMRGKGRSR